MLCRQSRRFKDQLSSCRRQRNLHGLAQTINLSLRRRLQSLQNLEDEVEADRMDPEHLEFLYRPSRTEIPYFLSPALVELAHLHLLQLGSFTPSKFLLDHLTKLLMFETSRHSFPFTPLDLLTSSLRILSSTASTLDDSTATTC